MIQNIIWYSLLLCIFSIPLFESPKNLLLAISAIFFFASHIKDHNIKKLLFTKDPRLGFLALIISSVISTCFASDPALALKGSADFLKMYLIFIIVSTDFSDIQSTRDISLTIIISATIASVWGIINHLVYHSTFVELNSVGHVNHSAIFLSLVLALTLALFLKSIFRRTIHKIMITAASIVNFAALILSGSRAAIIVCAIAFIFILWIQKNRKLTKYILIVAVVMFIILSTSNNLILFQKDISLSSTSMLERIKIWGDAWDMFEASPLVGVGAKHFGFYSLSSSGTHAHNLYLNILAQYGILGMLSFLLLICLSIKTSIIAFKRNSLGIASIGALVITLGIGFLNTTVHTEHGLLFSLILAIGQSDSDSTYPQQA